MRHRKEVGKAACLVELVGQPAGGARRHLEPARIAPSQLPGGEAELSDRDRVGALPRRGQPAQFVARTRGRPVHGRDPSQVVVVARQRVGGIELADRLNRAGQPSVATLPAHRAGTSRVDREWEDRVGAVTPSPDDSKG
jgi:hypothetical protein